MNNVINKLEEVIKTKLNKEEVTFVDIVTNPEDYLIEDTFIPVSLYVYIKQVDNEIGIGESIQKNFIESMNKFQNEHNELDKDILLDLVNAVEKDLYIDGVLEPMTVVLSELGKDSNDVLKYMLTYEVYIDLLSQLYIKYDFNLIYELVPNDETTPDKIIKKDDKYIIEFGKQPYEFLKSIENTKNDNGKDVFMVLESLVVAKKIVDQALSTIVNMEEVTNNIKEETKK